MSDKEYDVFEDDHEEQLHRQKLPEVRRQLAGVASVAGVTAGGGGEEEEEEEEEETRENYFIFIDASL